MLSFLLTEQVVEIERTREHFHATGSRARPLFARAIPIQFDAVFVWIAEIERFAHAVVGRAVERDTRPDQALKRVSQLRAGWIENREMIESSGAWRRRRPAETLPRIQADMVMIPARRNECRPSAVTLGELETEDAAVESQGALQIGHFQA